jgi:hypothetical protein
MGTGFCPQLEHVPMPALVRIAIVSFALGMLTVASLATAQTEQPPPAPAPAGPAGVGGPAGDDDDEGPPPVRPARAQPGSGEFGTGHSYGESRRRDPFEGEDDGHRAVPARQAAAGDADQAVVCVAGCDGPPGQVVAKVKR